MVETGRYWLFDWLDDEGAQTDRHLRAALAAPGVIEATQERANRASTRDTRDIGDAVNPIVAGRTIDLSGRLSCNHFRCLRKQVDGLFGRVWHYFDEIVVEGFTPNRFLQLAQFAPERARNDLYYHLQTALYIRRIGAEPYLIFRDRRSPCVRHGQRHLKEAGLRRIMADSGSIIDILARDGQITGLEQHEDHWHYAFKHPSLEIGDQGIVWDFPKDPNADPMRHVAKAVFLHQAGYLAIDVDDARAIGAPLATSFGLHSNPIAETDSPAAVALDLSLPILAGISARDIIKIRQDEALAFERFRHALTSVIQEQVNDPEATAKGSSHAATQLWNDRLRPAILDIEQRLGAAQKLLARKSALGIGVGATLTAVGMFGHMPLILSAGVASGVSPALHVSKYFEEVRDIQLSDFYFLWDLRKRSKS